MALFVATAHVYVEPQLKYEELVKFHSQLDCGINAWTAKAETLVTGFVLVDLTITDIGSPFLLVTASYRSSVPTDLSLQDVINRSLEEE